GRAAAASGTAVASVPVPDGTKASVAAGALLRVGGATLRVTADAPAGSTAIAVAASAATIADDTALFAVAYDYAANAMTTQAAAPRPPRRAATWPPAPTRARGPPAAPAGPTRAGTAAFAGQTAPCRWYGAGAGGSLSLDGAKGFAQAASAAAAAGTATPADLT